MNKPELLSPCGDYECFLAAIRAGCDAVYLGGQFSARAYAKNFSHEELLSAIDHAHLYSRKVYLTLNILLKDDETDRIIDYLSPLYEAGLDAVIVQDLGLIRMLRTCFPCLPIHASTQMTVTDTEGVTLLKEQGVSRVVLARELSLNEIREIREKTNMDLECFIHGALCYSYSGKCLMSSMIGGRSGNRGRCAQPCRLPYNGKYVISCKDICTLNILPELIDAKIASFKIEGRMKSPEYVAGVTGIYRKYIDAYLDDPKHYQVSQEDDKLLKTLYTRSGHTKGYYMQHNGSDMITINKPGYAKADEQLGKAAYERFTSGEYLLPLSLSVTLKCNEAAALKACCGEYEVTVYGENVEKARGMGLSEEDIIKQLRKLGGTDFTPKEITIQKDPAVFLPVSSVNALRREAALALKEAILSAGKRNDQGSDERLIRYRELKEVKPDNTDALKPHLHVSVQTLEQAKTAFSFEAINILSLPVALFKKHQDDLFRMKHEKESLQLYVILPYICRDGYFEKNESFLRTLLNANEISGVLIRNYESIGFLNSISYQKEIIADIHLYALNRMAYSALSECGVTHTTVPIELNKKELKRRAVLSEDLIIYGRLPLMVSAQCLTKTLAHCDHAGKMNILTDRYQVSFPAKSICDECYSVIYNSVPISLHADTDLIDDLHPYALRMMFTDEEDEIMKSILKDMAMAVYDKRPFDPPYSYTRGHLLRGVE